MLQQFYKSCGWGVNFAEKTHMLLGTLKKSREKNTIL